MSESKIEEACSPSQSLLSHAVDEVHASPSCASPKNEGKVSNMGVWLASRPAGQMLFRAGDKVLSSLEKTLLWYTQRMHKNEATEDVLVSRPLPWLLLIPLLSFLLFVSIWLRMLVGMNSAATIRWIHCRRQRLRSIRVSGFKTMRREQARNCSLGWGPVQCVLWFLGFSRNVKHEEAALCTVEPHASEKRKYCEVEQSDWTESSDEENVEIMLQNCCNGYNSASDPDFEPGSDGFDASDEEASTTTGDGSGDEHDLNADDILNQNVRKLHRTKSLIPEPPTPVDERGFALVGEFAGSPMPLAAVTSSNESKIARFFVPFVRRLSGNRNTLSKNV